MIKLWLTATNVKVKSSPTQKLSKKWWMALRNIEDPYILDVPLCQASYTVCGVFSTTVLST